MRLRARLVALGLFGASAACGALLSVDEVFYLGGDAGGDALAGVDAQASDAESTDALGDVGADAGAEGGPRCSSDAAFGAPSLVTGLQSQDTESARLSDDELTAYVSQNGALEAGFSLDLFVVTRPTLADPFGPPVTPSPVAALNVAAANERQATVSRDGLRIVFSRATSASEIWSAVRQPNAPFDSPTFVKNGLTFPYLAPDESSFYATTGTDIKRITLSGQSDVTVLLAPLGATLSAPVVSRDDLTLYFGYTGAIDGGASSAGMDVWRVRRSSKNAVFDVQSIAPVPELSSPDDDAPMWLSPDGCAIYLKREKGGSPRIWVAHKPPSP